MAEKKNSAGKHPAKNHPGKKGGKAKGRKQTAGSGRKQAVRAAGLLRRVVTWSLVAAIWCGVAVVGVLAWYAYDLPDIG